MKMKSYLDFLAEAKTAAKMMIFYSEGFRKVLSLIATSSKPGKEVAIFLLGAEESNQALDEYTLIDKTDKNDMISYVQASRFQREYPTMGIEDLELYKATATDKFWTQGRTPHYGIGRWVRHVFADVYGTPIENTHLEEFVNAYKSTYDSYVSGKDSFLLVEGEDIRKWYLGENYADGDGQLWNSCMRYAKCQPYLDIYVKNPQACKLLILMDESGQKILGRALIWTLKDGSKYMDRVYTIKNSDVLLFKEWAEKNKIKTFYPNIGDLEVQLGDHGYEYYPYMDTFEYYNQYKHRLTTSASGEDGELILKETDGTTREYNEDRVFSEWHNQFIDREYAAWCEDIDDYVHIDDAVWLEYKGYYVSPRSETRYSEWCGEVYYKYDLVYSECMDDYLYPEDCDIVFFKTDSQGGEDCCAEKLIENYIEVDGKYYSRKNYKMDPFTGEYGFLNEMEGGITFRERLIEKLREELGEIGDGFWAELKQMLLEYKPREDFIKELMVVRPEFLESEKCSYLIPGLYAHLLDQERVRLLNMNSEKRVKYFDAVYKILEEMEGIAHFESLIGIPSAKKFYQEVFSSGMINAKKMIRFAESFDISEFPDRIHKMILYSRL